MPDFILILSWFCPDFVLVLSWFCPGFILILSCFVLILSWFYFDFILTLSLFHQSYPYFSIINFVRILTIKWASNQNLGQYKQLLSILLNMKHRKLGFIISLPCCRIKEICKFRKYFIRDSLYASWHFSIEDRYLMSNLQGFMKKNLVS